MAAASHTSDTLASVRRVSTAGTSASRRYSNPNVGYPNGHIGHLTPEETQSLLEFRALVEEKGYYKPGPPPSHQDHTLLRYLRARRWSVRDAFKQFQTTEDWRKANDLDVLYESFDDEAFEHTRRMYPQWTGRRDRRGIPVYLFKISELDSKTVAAYEKAVDSAGFGFSRARPNGQTPARLLRLIGLYESLTRFLQPLCTELPGRDCAAATPVTLSTNIVDVSRCSMRQYWQLKGHMQAASVLATAHYPETLDRIFIVGAPVFFTTVWGWIKRWFDPATVAKIFVLGPAEVRPTLEAFIDPENIPKQYGGRLDFNWLDHPNLDPEIAARADWAAGKEKAFPRGPLFWRPVDGDPDRLECIATGSSKGADRFESVCTIKRCFYPGVLGADTNKEGAAAAAAAVETHGVTAAVEGRLEGQRSGEMATAPPEPATTTATQGNAGEPPSLGSRGQATSEASESAVDSASEDEKLEPANLGQASPAVTVIA